MRFDDQVLAIEAFAYAELTPALPALSVRRLSEAACGQLSTQWAGFSDSDVCRLLTQTWKPITQRLPATSQFALHLLVDLQNP